MDTEPTLLAGRGGSGPDQRPAPRARVRLALRLADGGNLTLTGAVKYGRQRDMAELAVAGLTGVRNIKDEIEISYDADPADVTRLVQDALDPTRWSMMTATSPWTPAATR